MKAIDVEIPPFALRSSRRWLTPVALGALLGVVALAVPTVRQFFVFEGLRWLYILLFAFLGAGALTPFMVASQPSVGVGRSTVRAENPCASDSQARWRGCLSWIPRFGAVELDSAGLDDRDPRSWIAAVGGRRHRRCVGTACMRPSWSLNWRRQESSSRRARF